MANEPEPLAIEDGRPMPLSELMARHHQHVAARGNSATAHKAKTGPGHRTPNTRTGAGATPEARFAGVADERMKDVVKARLAICDACDQKMMLAGTAFCRQCSCALSLKTRLKNSRCPIGRW